MHSQPNISLALGAGGARGLAHIHVLSALDDLGLKPVEIAGTSIGSIIGAAYAAGMTGHEIEHYVRDCFENYVGLLAKALSIRPASIQEFFDDGGFRVGELSLENILEVFLPKEVPDNFNQLEIPLSVVATDYFLQESCILTSGDLTKALASSGAIPAVFLPVRHENTYLFDGYASNPCPMDIVQRADAQVIAVDVSGGVKGNRNERPSKLQVTSAANQTLQKAFTAAEARRQPNTILLRPPVQMFGSLDFLSASEILDVSSGLRDQVKYAIHERLSRKLL